ncbi:MAG: non-heme iron oxygenase ferredoxin subunit [Chloroflexi bacterium]|nr:non-heme iron oxygenase ferredoxin subunit [Chloroflexota bacterium]
MSDFRTIATANQLPPGERIVVTVDETYIAVFNVGGNIYAIEDACTHDDGPLAEGILIEDADNPKIECDRHGATFELKTGKPTFPAVVPVRRFPVRVEGDAIQIDVQSLL